MHDLSHIVFAEAGPIRFTGPRNHSFSVLGWRLVTILNRAMLATHRILIGLIESAPFSGQSRFRHRPMRMYSWDSKQVFPPAANRGAIAIHLRRQALKMAMPLAILSLPLLPAVAGPQLSAPGRSHSPHAQSLGLRGAHDAALSKSSRIRIDLSPID